MPTIGNHVTERRPSVDHSAQLTSRRRPSVTSVDGAPTSRRRPSGHGPTLLGGGAASKPGTLSRRGSGSSSSIGSTGRVTRRGSSASSIGAPHGLYSPEEIKEAFERLDTNRDGFLDFHEFRGLLLRGSNGDLSDKQLRAIFRCVDRDNDNRVEFDEFVDWVHGKETKPHKERWEDTFLAFAGRDDRLCLAEFLALMESSELLDEGFEAAAAEGIFARVCGSEELAMTPAGFSKAVASIAKSKGVKKAEVLAAVAGCKPPHRHTDYYGSGFA